MIPYWLGNAPEFEHWDEEITADVIVCGAGIAGVSAARAAAEAGAECLLFEKSGHVQGRSGQFSVIGGEFMKKWWGMDNRADTNAIVNEWMRSSNYRARQSILKYAADHMGEDFDWYMEALPADAVIARDRREPAPEGTKTRVFMMHMPFREGYDGGEERFPVYPYTVSIQPHHLPVLWGHLQLGLDTGRLVCRFHTPVRGLIREESGRVTGVFAEAEDGRVVKAFARKGVILATGDYSGDPDMLRHYCPGVADNPRIPMGYDKNKRPLNSGDGHRMGLWIGAKMETGPHAANNHNMGGVMGVTPFLQLDMNGCRFMNEDAPGHSIENAIQHLKGKSAWQLFDSAWPEQISAMPYGHGSCSSVMDDEAVAAGREYGDYTPWDGVASAAFLEKMVEKGVALRADTLEELIGAMGLPRENALASILRYNTLAVQGNDEDFGKDAGRMFPLVKAPFYASRIRPAPLLCCHGGFENDEFCRCFDENMDIIPGLYVCGNVQGNRFAVDYPTTMPGCSHSLALSLGRRAGRSAADGI